MLRTYFHLRHLICARTGPSDPLGPILPPSCSRRAVNLAEGNRNGSHGYFVSRSRLSACPASLGAGAFVFPGFGPGRNALALNGEGN